MDTCHNLMQLLVDFLSRPSHTHGVLSHLQARGSHTTCVDSLARSEELTSSNELVDGISRATHVRHLGYAQRLLSQNGIGIVAVELVLSGAGQVDVGLLFPRFLALKESRALELLSIRSADIVAAGTQLKQVLNLLIIESSRIIDISIRTADGDNLGTQLSGLLGGTPSYVSKA